MKNNDLEVLADKISNGPFKEPMWADLLAALDGFHTRVVRLEEIERERCLFEGDPTKERPKGVIKVHGTINQSN